MQIFHELGVRFMQLTYNNQSVLGGGCYEAEDSGLTRFGREVIAEMNRVGMVIDLSHSGERTHAGGDRRLRPPGGHQPRQPDVPLRLPRLWRPRADSQFRALAARCRLISHVPQPRHSPEIRRENARCRP